MWHQIDKLAFSKSGYKGAQEVMCYKIQTVQNSLQVTFSDPDGMPLSIPGIVSLEATMGYEVTVGAGYTLTGSKRETIISWEIHCYWQGNNEWQQDRDNY